MQARYTSHTEGERNAMAGSAGARRNGLVPRHFHPVLDNEI
jgi:hypothetical protein